MPEKPWDKPWKPWEDPSLKSEETPSKPKPKPSPRLAPPPKRKKEPTALDAWGQADKLRKRNEEIELGTRGIRKALPGQGL